MNTKILAKLLALDEVELYGMVSPRTIKDIKREDPRPWLLAFVIGQEGEATPTQRGLGQVLTNWYRSAIEALTSKLGLGTPVYHGHAGQGPDRSQIGEVIGKLTKRIGDAISAIAVTYIYPQFQDVPYDVASIEASVNVPADSRAFSVEEADVQAITGIALGNSSVDRPAFPGATLIAQLQAFAETNRPKGGETMKITLEEIRTAIQEGKHSPSDVFDPSALTADPFIKQHVEEKTGNAKGYTLRKLEEAEIKIRALETDKKTLADQLATATAGTLKIRAKEQFDAVLAERPALKGDERLMKFVRKQFEKSFTPTDEAKLKDDLNKFVDGQVGEFTELFGEPKKAAGNQAVKPGAPAAKKDDEPKADGDPEADPLLDPANNDLIPKD